MRVQTEEWQRFIPGIRMYNGKITLFYNGEKLWEGDDEDGRPLVYNKEERLSWQVIIVLPGVEIIPEFTFYECKNVKKVIMADTVKRVEKESFLQCYSLKFVKLSRNLEYIGAFAFCLCKSLTSIFIPPSCREIGTYAFSGCKKLLMLGMPRNINLGECIFEDTRLLDAYTGEYDFDDDEEEDDENRWVKCINNGDAYALHRACSSFNPLPEIVYTLVKRLGIKAMQMKNLIGVSPSQYLAANTFANISENEIIKRYISEMMGEV